VRAAARSGRLQAMAIFPQSVLACSIPLPLFFLQREREREVGGGRGGTGGNRPRWVETEVVAGLGSAGER